MTAIKTDNITQNQREKRTSMGQYGGRRLTLQLFLPSQGVTGKHPFPP